MEIHLIIYLCVYFVTVTENIHLGPHYVECLDPIHTNKMHSFQCKQNGYVESVLNIYTMEVISDLLIT